MKNCKYKSSIAFFVVSIVISTFFVIGTCLRDTLTLKEERYVFNIATITDKGNNVYTIECNNNLGDFEIPISPEIYSKYKNKKQIAFNLNYLDLVKYASDSYKINKFVKKDKIEYFKLKNGGLSCFYIIITIAVSIVCMLGFNEDKVNFWLLFAGIINILLILILIIIIS